jgi:hypothetical protein
VNGLRIDLLAGFVERAFDDGFVHGCRQSRCSTGAGPGGITQ